MKVILYILGFFALLAALITFIAKFPWSSGSAAAGLASLNDAIAACRGVPNGSTLTLADTSRLFINLPRGQYPSDISSYFISATGTVGAGWVSNAGLPGEAFQATPDCSSTYFEFDGSGILDLNVPGKSGVPPYRLRFIVGG